EYDASYDLAKTMFRLVGLRLTHNDPPLARLLWNALYLFEAINVLLAMFLELIKMKQTARDGSFIELFTMMPCVGFLALGFMLPTDALFWVFLSHITTQFDLLAIRLKKMFYVPLDRQLIAEYPLAQYSLECDTDNNIETEKVYQKKLVDVILKHRALIRMSGVVEEQFTFSLLINFINSSIIICFCGFCCMVSKQSLLNHNIISNF
ncbi:hypothetical protein RR48_05457, partial [Papilio machaon]